MRKLIIPLFTSKGGNTPFYGERNTLPPQRDFAYLPPEKPRASSKKRTEKAIQALVNEKQKEFVANLLKK